MHLCPFSIDSRIMVRLKKLEGGCKSDFPRARSQVPANGSLDWPKTERPILATSTAKTIFLRRFIMSARLAHKIRCIVRAAGSLVNGHLRVWTQWPGALDDAIAQSGSNDLIRCFSVLFPLFECAEHVEIVRPFPTSAVRHAGHHKQAVGIIYRLGVSYRVAHLLVIADAVTRNNKLITPAMVLEQFTTAGEKRFQIRIGSSNRS